MGLRNALRMYRGSAQAVPPGAARPSTTLWWNPGLPPVSWTPQTGIFETHWDWCLTEALAIPGYWKGRQLISQAIGGMPLAAWKDGAPREPNPAVLREPAQGEDRCTTVAAWVADLVDHGNAFGVIANRDSEGKATTIVPFPSIDVRMSRDRDGRLWYVPFVEGQPTRPREPWEVFHAKGVLPYPGAPRGMGVLEAGLSTLSRMSSEATYAANAFRTGTPSGLLRIKDPDLQVGSPDDPAGYATATGIKKAWKENISTGDIAVLSELVDFTPLAWSPTDAQMVEARQLSLVDVANLFALDPFWVGSAQTSAPYQNVQDAAVQLVRFTLAPWITVLEAQFSRLLPAGTEARFNRDTILREQRAERVATEISMVAAGIATIDEVRGWEGLPPLAVDDSPPADVVPLFPAESDTATNQPASETG